MKKYLTLSALLASTVIGCAAFADELPHFECVLTDQLKKNEEPGSAKDTFTKTTPKIYYVCQSDEVEKGQTLKSVWIAKDTNGVAPANYQIDEKSIVVPKANKATAIFTAYFALSKPANGWPLGTYHVDVYLDEELVKTAPFSVK